MARRAAPAFRGDQQLVELVRPRALRRPVGRDPDDEAVIAAALAIIASR